MRAAFIREHGGPGVLELGEAPEPILAHGTAIVDVRAVALNHLDLWVRRGMPGLTVRFPHIGGSDVAGVVAAVGPGVEGWEPGDRVIVNPSLWCGECAFCERGEHPLCARFMILGEHVPGGAAEKVRVPGRNLYRIPDSLGFEEAAAVPLVFQTAWRALVGRARLAPGETLLVTGASGGVSTAAIQIGKLLGARVVAVSSGPAKVARVRELGADVAIDRLSRDVVGAVRACTGGQGVNVLLDSVGDALWRECLRCLGRGGRLVTYGATTGSDVRLDVRRIFWKQQEIIGTTMASRQEFEEAMGHVMSGELQAVVDEVMPLDRIREAHERLEAGEVFGKLVLVP
jgi:NADPH:quinone reductase-like Zn-dependent oxidoreductase